MQAFGQKSAKFLLFAVNLNTSKIIIYIVRAHVMHIHKKKRRPRVAHSQTEAFALPIESNKQQETYADMTNRPTKIR